MRLSVGESGNLSFLVSAYQTRCADAKALVTRLRSVLTQCKEASDLEGLLEYFGPYIINHRLKKLQFKIERGRRSDCSDSILDVAWAKDGASLSNDSYCKLSSTDSTLGEEADGDGARLLRNHESVEPDMFVNPVLDRAVGRNCSQEPPNDNYRTLSRFRSECSFEKYRPLVYRSYGGMESARSEGSRRARPELKNIRLSGSFDECRFNKDAEALGAGEPLRVESARAAYTGMVILGQLCSPEFLMKGCTNKADIAVACGNAYGDGDFGDARATVPALDDDLSDDDRVLLSALCNTLSKMLMFVVDSANHQLRWLRSFDSVLEEVVRLLEGIVSEGHRVMKTLSDSLNGHSATYAQSVAAYEKALSKFYKLEKALESGIASRSSTLSDAPEERLDCRYKECACHEPAFEQIRRKNRNVARKVLTSPKDFVRYTNYIEQMSLTHYLRDNLLKDKHSFELGLTEALGTFADHYSRAVFDVETLCMEKLTGASSLLMESTYTKACNFTLCREGTDAMLSEGSVDLHFSLNVQSNSLKDFIHSVVVECFDSMRSLSKKLAQLHYAQMGRFSRLASRFPLKLCDRDANAMFKAYQRYHKHMHSMWWSLYTTISAVFPKNGSNYRRSKDFSQPLLGEFLEVKMPLRLLHNISSQFATLVNKSSEHTFNVCSAALQLCKERAAWHEFLASLAEDNQLDAGELQGVVARLQSDADAKRGESPSSSGKRPGAGESIHGGGAAGGQSLVSVTDRFPQCRSSTMVSNLLCVIEHLAEALVDYNEAEHKFSFKRGDVLHVRIAGNTPLWFGHGEAGRDRWFPAKFVRPLSKYSVPLFRRADLECETYLDDCCVRESSDAAEPNVRRSASIMLSSKANLKQALMLSKLGLEGKVEHEFKCSLCRKIVLRGTLYLTKTHLGFISSFNDATLFGTQTTLTVPLEDIAACDLTSSKAISFYVRLQLRSGETQLFHSVIYARRIRDAIVQVANLDGAGRARAADAGAAPDLRETSDGDEPVESEELTRFFGTLEPLSRALPPVYLRMDLQNYFSKALRDNVSSGSRVADTRLMHNAFDFSGDLEPVDFDWELGGFQSHSRCVHYSFRLKDGKLTALLPRQTCGKAREEIKYALVDRRQLVYESRSYTSDIPYSSYFYTVFRVTATRAAAERIHVRTEYSVTFLKSTLFSSVISAEAYDRMATAAQLLVFAGEDSCEPQGAAAPASAGQRSVLPRARADGMGASMNALVGLCLLFLGIYTSLLAGWR